MPTIVTDTDTATVIATKIIGTDCTVVTAWEQADGYSSHTSTRSDAGDGRLGQITSRNLPAEIEAMTPGSPERMSAAIDFHAANVADSVAAIRRVYPDLLDRDDATLSHGAVTCQGSPSLVPCSGGCGELVEPNFVGIAWCGTPGR